MATSPFEGWLGGSLRPMTRSSGVTQDLTVNAIGLWANLGPPIGYRVTVAAEDAPQYAVVAGCFMALAFMAAGHWLLRRRTLRTVAGRLAVLVVAGSVSVAWAAAWLSQHSGRVGLVPVDGVWNYAVELQWFWLAVLGVLLVLGVHKMIRHGNSSGS